MAKLLIADSSQEAVEKLTIFLKRDSHEVKIFDESEALDTILSENKFDVIIVDLQFQGCPSSYIVETINQNKLNSYTQVIGTTSLANRDLLNKFISAGVSYLFMKPYRYKLLAEKIKKIVEPKQSAHGAFEPLILKIFLESTIHIFETMAGSSITAGKPFLKSGNKSLADISAVIQLSSSQVVGSMSINLDRNILIRFLFKLFGNTVPADEIRINEMCGEICNQIMGRAKKQFLEKKNMGFEISTPTVLSEPNHILDYKSSSPVLIIPFNFEKSEGIFVEFCLKLTNENNSISEENSKIMIEEGGFTLL